MATTLDDRIRSDADFLGLHRRGADGDGGIPGTPFSLVVSSPISRPDRRLYGGAALAASISAAEVVTGREVLWMTTQFASIAESDAELDVRLEVMASGHRTSQVRVTGTGPDGVVFASLGAAGVPRPEGMAGSFEELPKVSRPEDGETAFGQAMGDFGWTTFADVRIAEVQDHPTSLARPVALWLRRRDREPLTPALTAYLADMVPLSIARACGVRGAGTSLDNTVRFGAPVDTEWVLVDLRPALAVGSYGHGRANLWSEDGRLLGVASQSATLFEFPDDHDPLGTEGSS